MHVFYFVTFVTLCLSGYTASESETFPFVRTSAGTFNGISEQVKVKDRHVVLNKYLGIPYAQPPVGNLRFMKTQPLEKLESAYNADKFRPACRQVAIPVLASFDNQAEDCLFLNVYSPVQAPDRETGHAVMVFIHGGAFVFGAGDVYHGEKLAAYGNVIVVTVNYRLGILGFFGTGDEEAPGNLGFWDQIMALKWVHDNIEGFGGDQSRVTVFGESAGGTAVLYHALYPDNKGLFQRVISQSGAHANAIINSDGPTVFGFVSEKLNCKRETTKVTIECLQEMGLEDIMNTLNELMQNPENVINLRFYPQIDGDLIKVHPGSLTQLSQIAEIEQIQFFRSIDTIIGCNSQEGGMFVAFPITIPIEDPQIFSPTREEFETQILPLLISLEFGPDAPAVIRSLFVAEYTDWTSPNSLESVRQNFLDVWGDLFFNVAAVEMNQLHANYTESANTFSYLFQATPTTPLLRKIDWLEGANHVDELGYVFGFGAGIMAANQSYKEPFPWEYDLSYKMMAYWSNFAKYGNPNAPEEIEINLSSWPSYDMNTKQHIILDKDISVGQNMFAKRANFWLNVIPDVMSALADKQQALNDRIDGFCTADGGCEGD